MNPLLEKKYQELKNAGSYECWYLVKQPTAFDNICYLVSFLKKYQESGSAEQLQDYIESSSKKLRATKPNIEISDNYRALRVAAFFGLITMRSKGYGDALITPTYEEIFKRCNGEFEKTELYQDVIDRQIEKMFLSSEVDEEKEGVRKSFRLYPVMLLYKILLELGRTTGKYALRISEYRYIVATTTSYKQYLYAILLIKLMREDSESAQKFEEFREKFDNRLIQALKQLQTLTVDRDTITLKSERVSEVAEKIFIFESDPEAFLPENYLDFLGSTRELIELKPKEKPKSSSYSFDSARVGGQNRVIYGTPGCGKSYYVQNVLLPQLKIPEENVFRTTFYQDYTNTDFVGQILPKVNSDKSVSYEFNPGPFALALKRAIEKPDEAVALVIEELNRGNAPSIFGDIFQLLDRDTCGKSEYEIVNVNLQDFLNNCFKERAIRLNCIRIPANLYLIATMNTSDQNVFTLDTAFKRRWEFKKIKNKFDLSHPYRGYFVPGMDGMTWEEFVDAINAYIVSRNDGFTSEDKQIGVYFIAREVLCKERDECNDSKKKERFAYKIFEYLWDDVAKFSREDWFGSEIKSLDGLIDAFLLGGKTVLKNVIREG